MSNTKTDGYNHVCMDPIGFLRISKTCSTSPCILATRKTFFARHCSHQESLCKQFPKT